MFCFVLRSQLFCRGVAARRLVSDFLHKIDKSGSDRCLPRHVPFEAGIFLNVD